MGNVQLMEAWSSRVYTNELLALSPTDESKCGYVASSRAVVCGSRSGLVLALDGSSGSVLWSFRARGAVYGRPCSAEEGREVVLGSSDGCIYFVSSLDGAELRRFCPQAGAIHASPVCAGDRVYFATVQDRVFGVVVSGLEVVLDYAREQPEGLVGQASPTGVLLGQVLYRGFSDGTVVALDTSSGEPEWVSQVGSGTGPGAELRDVEWVEALGSRLYVAPVRKGPILLERSDGSVSWRGEFDGAGSPLVSGESLVFTTAHGEVVALGLRDLSVEYVRKVGACAYAPVSIGRWLVVGTDSALLLLDSRDGWPSGGLWFASGVLSRPLVVKNRLFFVTGQGFVHAVDVLGL